MSNRLIPYLLGIFALICLHANIAKTQCGDMIIVAADGSGDFTSVQAAVEAAPNNLTTPHRIFIKNGVYDEKIFITKNFITLIGENRDSTILTTAVLRRTWRENNPSDWGVATINIQNGVTDLTIANMTVRNNFADVYPDFPDNNDHTMAIRGGGHRVIIVNCNIIATGGDTLSLWNTDGGMFYHANCYFEGYVDYVAPRGYCFIRDSEFFGYNKNASIWLDGSGGEDHKFVIRNSYFDGIQNFALGRYHRDAQFYLLDCDFSDRIKNQDIQFVGSEPLQFGKRTYYYNTHREGFDFNWHRNNLREAPGNPDPDSIDARWTFNQEWDPESQLEGLLPFAFLPSPADEGCSPLSPTLSWTAGQCALAHRVYFGESPNPPMVGTVTDPQFTPAELQENTTYYWRVDELTLTDTIEGAIWQFTTNKVSDLTPNPAFAPEPATESNFFTGPLVRLEWSWDQCSVDSFLVYFGESPEELELESVQINDFYFPFGTKDEETYYWRVDTKNTHGITEGPLWSFVRNPSATSLGRVQTPAFDFSVSGANPFLDSTTLVFNIPKSGWVDISLHDARGRHLGTLVSEHRPAGTHNLTVNKEQLLNNNALERGTLVIARMRYEETERLLKLIIH